MLKSALKEVGIKLFHEIPLRHNNETAWIEAKENKISKSYTYNEINELSTKVYFYLKKQKVQKGDVIFLLSHARVEFLSILFACSKIGAIFCHNYPYTFYPVENDMLQCQPKILFYEKGTEIFIKSDHGGMKKICLDSKEFMSTMENMKISKSDLKKQEDGLDENTPLCLWSTSGTTGVPKLILNTQETLVNYSHFPEPKFTKKDKSFVQDVCNAAGVAMVASNFLFGAAIVVLAEMETPMVLYDFIKSHADILTRVWCFGHDLVNFYYKPIVPKNIKMIYYGGMKMQIPFIKKLLSLYPSIDFYEVYGMSECGAITRKFPNDYSVGPQGEDKKIGSVGKPVFFDSVRIVDSKTLKEKKQGVSGEIIVKTQTMMLRYLDDKQTKKALTKDGWVRTGDLGKIDEDGYLYLTGRVKDILVLASGINLNPCVIESVVSEVKGVEECYCFGIEDKKHGGDIISVAVIGNSVQKKDIIDACKKKLDDFLIPERIFFPKSLPKGKKVSKRKLREIYSSTIV